MNICSLRFLDIRENVTLWRLILWSLGCTVNRLQIPHHRPALLAVKPVTTQARLLHNNLRAFNAS
jgi:hypothetical protein